MAEQLIPDIFQATEESAIPGEQRMVMADYLLPPAATSKPGTSAPADTYRKLADRARASGDPHSAAIYERQAREAENTDR